MSIRLFKVLDITEKSRIKGTDQQEPSLTNEQLCIIFAVCHATGMLSACANPIIYGFLNENFHREFVVIFNCIHKKLSCKKCCTTTEFETNSSLSNGVNGRTDPNNQHIRVLMKYDIYRCCTKRLTGCCRETEEDSSNNNNVPLSVLGNNQQSISIAVTTGNKATNTTINADFSERTKVNGENKISPKKCVSIKEEYNDTDIILEENNAFPKNDMEKDNMDETVKLLADAGDQEVSILITSPALQLQDA